MAITLALLSLLFAGFNDLAFKLYARKDRSRGVYAFIIGLMMSVVFLIKIDWNSLGAAELEKIILWGGISGLLSIAANIMLIEAMSDNEAGICSTIYRLNLATGAILAFFILGESVSILKIAGIIFAVAAVILFCPESKGQKQSSNAKIFSLILVLTASILRAGMGISYKHGLSEGTLSNGILAMTGIMWMAGGALYFLLKEKKSHGLETMNLKNIAYGLFSGILICGIVFFLAGALKLGDASIILPVSQMSFLLTAFLGMLFLKEALTLKKTLGTVSSIICVILMSLAAS
jgi:uncharacterized membrane protein